MDTPTFSLEVARRVNAAIERGGHTVLGVAQATGIARSTLLRRLSGSSPLSVKELALIAQAIDVDVRTFIPRDEDDEWERAS